MKLYKYRDFSDSAETALERLFHILRSNTFWCAKPDALNDPMEFVWECDYQPSGETVSLLSEVLIKAQGKTSIEAHSKAMAAVMNRRLEALAKPEFEEMIKRCRQEIGLACFSTSNQNAVMWQRYGGGGNGVCVEIDVPDCLLNKQLSKVEYPEKKVLSVDQLLSAFLGDQTLVRIVYSVALLSKPSCWAPEEEIRFVSKKQDVSVCIVDSQISSITLGSGLDPEVRQKIQAFVQSLPNYLTVLSYEPFRTA